MKRNLLQLLPLGGLFMLFFILFSCNKKDFGAVNENNDQGKLSFVEAKNWYLQKHDEDITTIKLLNEGKGSDRPLTSYVKGVFAGEPDWANFQALPDKNGFRIPLDFTVGDGKKFVNSFRDILIYKDSLGTIKEYVLEVTFDNEYFYQAFSSQSQKSGIRKYSDPKTFTGAIKLLTLNNFPVKGAIYRNGGVIGEMNPKAGVQMSVAKNKNLLTSYIGVGGEMAGVTVYGYSQDPWWDNYINWALWQSPNIPPPNNLLVVPPPCNCDIYIPLWDFNTQPDTISNKIKNPCLYNIVANAFAGNLQNKISTYINDAFGNIYKHHLNFHLDTVTVNTDYADATVRISPASMITFEYDITFYAKNLKLVSSEMITAIAFHEAVHAWIYYMYSSTDTEIGHHNRMTQPEWRDRISTALQETFANTTTPLSKADADALAWVGLDNTAGWNTLDPLTQVNISNTINDYKVSLKGKAGCPF